MTSTGTTVMIELAIEGVDLREKIEAFPVSGALYRLARSPGAAQGAARGDLVCLHGDGTFDVISRSGSIAIQLLSEQSRRLDEALSRVRPALGALGGEEDGRTDHVAVFTISVDVGFAKIERAMSSSLRSFPEVHWMYGNVYAADGKTPLRWWE